MPVLRKESYKELLPWLGELKRKYKELSDFLVKIPIYGNASSLNVACATSIILYEIDRQRRV